MTRDPSDAKQQPGEFPVQKHPRCAPFQYNTRSVMRKGFQP